MLTRKRPLTLTRKLRGPLLFLCLAAMATSSGARAGEQTNRELARGFALEEWRMLQHDAAVATLREHLGEDPEDTDAAILLGQVLIDQKKVREAALMLRELALKMKPEQRGVALYHLADAFVRMGQIKEATATLAQAKRDLRLKDAVKKASAKLVAGKALPPLDLPTTQEDSLALPAPDSPFGWKGNLALQSAYDSNVLLSSETALASASATDASSPSASLATSLRYAGKQFQFDQALGGTFYTQAEAQTFNSLIVSAQQRWDRSAEKGGFGVKNQVLAMLLNFDGLGYYMSSDVLQPYWTWIWSGSTRTRLAGSVGYQDIVLADGAGDENERTGPLAGIDVDQDGKWGSWSWSAGLGFERSFAQGANYVSHTYSARASLLRPEWFWKLSFFGSLDGSQIDYLTSDSDRLDRNWGAALGFSRAWGKALQTQLHVSYRSNGSTVSDGVYQKMLSGIGVSYAF